MEIIKLTPGSLTDSIFTQMVEIESRCGLSTCYSPEVLRECVQYADTYACMDGETVAGFITIDPVSTDYFDNSLHIVNINVAKAYRRKGLAALMLRTVCGCYAQSHAGQYVTLDVEKTNAPALALYRKLGFTISDLPSENGDGDWMMLMPLAELVL